MAGLPLFVARKPDEIDYFKAEIETILKSVLNSINLQDNGVYVQASTLGSLEAFLELLTTHKIPVKLYSSSRHEVFIFICFSVPELILDLYIGEMLCERLRNLKRIYSK